MWKIPISNEEAESLHLHLSELTPPKGHMPVKYPSAAKSSVVTAKAAFNIRKNSSVEETSKSQMKETFITFHRVSRDPSPLKSRHSLRTLKISLLLMVIQKFPVVAYNNHSRIVFLEETANKRNSLIPSETQVTSPIPFLP